MERNNLSQNSRKQQIKNEQLNTLHYDTENTLLSNTSATSHALKKRRKKERKKKKTPTQSIILNFPTPTNKTKLNALTQYDEDED